VSRGDSSLDFSKLLPALELLLTARPLGELRASHPVYPGASNRSYGPIVIPLKAFVTDVRQRCAASLTVHFRRD